MKVVPVLEVRKAISMASTNGIEGYGGKEAIKRLGGRGPAAQRLKTYADLPLWATNQRYRCVSVILLGQCDQRAVPALVHLLQDGDSSVRICAARSLRALTMKGALGEAGGEACVALESVRDDHQELYAVRRDAERALKEIYAWAVGDGRYKWMGIRK